MALYDEEEIRKEKENSKKIGRYIAISIIIVLISIFVLIGIIYYLTFNPNKITIYLDGKQNIELEEVLEVVADADGTTTIYAPIRTIASKFGYTSSNGDYTTPSEDKSSCHVISEKEIAIFNVNSNVIYKIDKTIETTEYEEVKIENDIIEKNGELHADEQGLEQGFNISISYNEQKKEIYIYTLDKVIETATSYAAKNNYTLDESFVNQKAILDNMMVVINENELQGVIDFSTGKEILGIQYDEITYIPQKSVFLIKKNEKVGMISKDGTTKISPKYDELTLIDNEYELYLAKNNGLSGVIDINEKIIIYLEYEQIGVEDISNYEQNGIKNGYLLLNKLIPVKQDEKWGFFIIDVQNVNGEKTITSRQITNIEYENIGCISETNKSVVYNLLLIEDYNVVVVGKNEKYTFMNLEGKEVLSCVFDDIYMEVSAGNKKYNMIYNNKIYNVIENLEKAGVTKKQETDNNTVVVQ